MSSIFPCLIIKEFSGGYILSSVTSGTESMGGEKKG